MVYQFRPVLKRGNIDCFTKEWLVIKNYFNCISGSNLQHSNEIRQQGMWQLSGYTVELQIGSL